MIKMHEPIRDFTFTTTDTKQQNFTQFRGKNIILYFYPKDSTPGCTQEGKDFASFYPQFAKQDTVILGVSRDSIASHQKFKEKYCFPFPLITDQDEALCQYFDVIKMKNLYGLKVRSIERSTFLIDKKGILQKEWRGVKVQGHVEAVLEAVKTLNQ